MNDIKSNQNQKPDSKKSAAPASTPESGRRIIIGLVVVLVLFLGVATAIFVTTNKTHNAEMSEVLETNANLNEDLAVRDSLVNEWVSTLNNIEADLLKLQGKEKMLIEESKDPELSNDSRANIMNEIQEINALLKKNKQTISALNRRLKNSGMKIASLQGQVQNLETELGKRDSSISELKLALVERDFRLGELNNTVQSLNADLQRTNSEVMAQQEVLNRAYIVAGNPKELEDKGIITEEGGFLGLLGKSKTISPDANNAQFDEIDITQTKQIAVNSKKADLITEHPVNSYELVRNDSIIAYLEIKNPDEFWKLSKYAVLATK